MIGLGRSRAVGAPGTGLQPGLAHEPGDAILRGVEAPCSEFVTHARATVGVGVTMSMNGGHFLNKFGVFDLTRAARTFSGGMVAAG